MQGRFLRWTRRHFYVVVSFAVGIALGVSIVALVYFSNKSEIAAHALRYGAFATGHVDLDDDLIWFVAGIAVGAGVACYAWWRDGKARDTGLEEEDVLNRMIVDTGLGIVGRPGEARQGPGE